MNNELKCPFCGEELAKDENLDGGAYVPYFCENDKCMKSFLFYGTKEMWEALIQSQQQLKLLEPIVASLQGRADINAEVARDSNELVVQWYEKYEQSQKDLEESQQATLENAQTILEIHKDLEIARKALDKADRFFDGTIGLYQSEMHAIIKTALEQIEHKETTNDNIKKNY